MVHYYKDRRDKAVRSLSQGAGIMYWLKISNKALFVSETVLVKDDQRTNNEDSYADTDK